MKITYTLDKQQIRRGASAHYSHRAKILKYLRPVIGLFAIICGLIMLMGPRASEQVILATVCITAGVLCLLRKPLYLWQTANNAFKGRPNTIKISLTASEEGLEMHDGRSESKAPWDTYVDRHFCSDGILLYQQKNIFYWIPKTEVEEGTWVDFSNLVLEKVVKKI